MSSTIRDVWFLLCPGAELLDLAGPWEVLTHANDTLGHQAYRPHLVTAAGRTTTTRHGLTLTGAHPLSRAAALPPAHTLVVAGGSPAWPPPPTEHRFARWLAQHHGTATRLVSICTGAFVLGEAGLLDGRRATTHWRYLTDLRSRYPNTHVIDGDIYVRDGRLWTSAGITAGIDLTLALVAADHGDAPAASVARNLLLFLRRSGHQAQFSEALKRQETAPPALRDVTTFVLDHLDEPIPVQRLADHLRLTTRTLTRWCRAHLGQPPAALIRTIRLDEARRLLEQTTLPAAEIATHVGIGDASTLWRTFTSHLGVTPEQYRQRFTPGTPPTGRSHAAPIRPLTADDAA